MAYLPTGDWDVQAGAGYFANGIGKSGAGDLDVLDTLIFASGKYIQLAYGAETATIEKTSTALNIINGSDAINIDAKTTHLFAIDGTSEIEIDSGGLIVKGANTIDLNNSANTETASLQRDDTALIIDSGTGGILDLKIAGTSELKLNATELFPSTTLGLTLGTSSYIFDNVYAKEHNMYGTMFMNPPTDGAYETTDATPLSITKAMTADETWRIHVYVVGRSNTAGSDYSCSYELSGTFERAGTGNVTQIGTTINHDHVNGPPAGTMTDNEQTDNASTNCTLTTSTTNIVVQVTGIAGIKFWWNVAWFIVRVPSPPEP